MMKQTNRQNKLIGSMVMLLAAAVVMDLAAPAQAAYVTPRIGGAQRKHDVAPMIMPEITFDGTTVRVLNGAGVDWVTLTGDARPVMWPLQGTDEFDPASVWYNALNGTAYNWQYGWNNAGFNPALLPANGKVWIELLSQSDGLSAYDRYNNSYAPIFGTDGSSMRWKWTEMMAHNAYTVDPQYAEWFANYRVYIGDAVTGDPLAGFGSADVTFTWTSVPEPATFVVLLTGIACACRRKRKSQG